MSAFKDSSHESFATIKSRESRLPTVPLDPFDFTWPRKMTSYIGKSCGEAD
jgi:hypothetical protein